MTDDPRKPPHLPEEADADADTQPVPPQDDDTQPKRPLFHSDRSELPAPPESSTPAVIRRRKRRTQRRGLWSALGIAVLLSLIIVLLGLIVLLAVTPEYLDPFIPGRAPTRTAQAAAVLSTDAAFATREANFAATQRRAQTQVAATETAAIALERERATRSALNTRGTSVALEQTATGAVVAFEATRTTVALELQSTIDSVTREALAGQASQTAEAINAQATDAAATAQAAPTNTAFVPGLVQPRAGRESPATPLPERDTTRLNTYFADNFEGALDPAWQVSGDWRVEDGTALATVCGASLQVGTTEWAQYAIDMTVDNPGAQYAVILGYGDSGRLFINFGAQGGVWWLVDGADAIPDGMQAQAYTPRRPQNVRVIADGRVVAVYVDGQPVAERRLPQSTRGPVGVYTCPTNTGQLAIPAFESFQVVRLSE